MKRVGILTFHRAVNYGAFLQSFSLSNKLKSEFPDCQFEIVDYIAPLEQTKIYKNILREGYHHGIGKMFLELEKRRVFLKALENLSLSPKFLKTKDINVLFNYINERYDVIIVGSDAIFNWNQNGFPSAFFLNYDFNIPLLSYAASVHGMKYQLMNNFQRGYCNKSFARFSFLGVRDKNTEDFIHYCGEDFQPVHTCDPTVFIDIEIIHNIAGGWADRVTKKFKIDLNKPFIVSMTQQDEIARAIKDRYGSEFQIVSLFKYSKYADYYLYDLNPFEWVALLSKTRITFTDYFHGTLLTLKSGRPVISIDASGYDGFYEGKLKDLMVRRLNLPDFYYTKEELKEADRIKKMFEISDKAINGYYTKDILKGMDLERKNLNPFIKYFKHLV